MCTYYTLIGDKEMDFHAPEAEFQGFTKNVEDCVCPDILPPLIMPFLGVAVVVTGFSAN